ncbi:hypothetical protein [Egicoccus sp. AB-alg2]|uniref:hypothetical protein n=1 Tax=Egicoccus sp. AB-alg2 TaxID=3242693 RepID=UPI00359E7ABA
MHDAHADAWAWEGRVREPFGGGSARLGGLRLMASGLPDARWNNADVTGPDPDLSAAAAWYAALGVPWGLRVPHGRAVSVGTPLFVKRCFALAAGDARFAGALPADVVVRRAEPTDLERFVGVEAAAFGDPLAVARRWIGPAWGAPGFEHWLGEVRGRPAAVATTVTTAGDAGGATMVTGLGRLSGTPAGLSTGLLRHVLASLAATAPRQLVHVHVAPGDDLAPLAHLGFREFDGLTVRVVVA